MNINLDEFKNKKIAIAVSGGMDSMALMHMLRDYDVVVLHVNHKLRDAADTEAEYVKSIAKQCVIFEWNDDKPESNLESAARDARYKLMTDWCRENGIDTLLTAHQADDQIETFLMNLSRGSGVYGLAAMRGETVRCGVKIVRPLLNVSRGEIKKYCDDNNIKYFSDEMNDDEKYTRVMVRKNRHLLRDKMGISDARILLAIQNLGRTRDALDEYVNDKIVSVLNDRRAIFHESFLFDEPDDIRLKLLGRLIQIVGENEFQPRLNSLQSALARLGRDCKFTLGGCVLRRLAAQVLIVANGESVSFRKRHYP